MEGLLLFFCGIDIAKRSHEASVIAVDGKPLLDSIIITNIQEDCDKLFSLFEWWNINRFDAPNKLVAFAGLYVKVTQSGEFARTKQKLSKSDSPDLQQAVWIAA